MACINLLIINIVLLVSVQAFNNGPGFQPFQVPLPPLPFLGQIHIPIIRLPIISTLKQIKNTIPKPGQLFNGIFAQSSSGFTKDKDGKYVRVGENYVLTNNNGEVHEFKHVRG